MTDGRFDLQMGQTGFHTVFNGRASMQSDIMGLAPVSNAVLAYAPQVETSMGADRAATIGRVGITVSGGRANGAAATAITASLARGMTELRASLIEEDGAMLGARSSGALRLGRGATTGVMEARHRLDLGGWAVEGYTSVDATRLNIDGASLVTSAPPLIGTRFGLQATGPVFGGALSLGIAQPLTIESGTAQLTFGSGYDAKTQTFRFTKVDVRLSGERRLALSAGHALATSRSTFRMDVTHDVRNASTGALFSLGATLP